MKQLIFVTLALAITSNLPVLAQKKLTQSCMFIPKPAVIIAPAMGGNLSGFVQATGDCIWLPGSASPFIDFPIQQVGSGSRQYFFSIQPNLTTAMRYGQIQAGTSVVMVIQPPLFAKLN